MSTAITLAGPDHMGTLLGLMSRRVTEGQDAEENDAIMARQNAVEPLLDGGRDGAAWLIGPTRAPLGYVIVTFQWSLTSAKRDAWVQDVYIRPNVRRRGIATEVLHTIAVSLKRGGIGALHVRLTEDDAIARAFCGKAGFVRQSGTLVMTDHL